MNLYIAYLTHKPLISENNNTHTSTNDICHTIFFVADTDDSAITILNNKLTELPNYAVLKLQRIKQVEGFYVKLGMSKMPQTFIIDIPVSKQSQENNNSQETN